MNAREERMDALRRRAAVEREDLAEALAAARDEATSFRSRWRYRRLGGLGPRGGRDRGLEALRPQLAGRQGRRIASAASLLLGIGRGVQRVRRFWSTRANGAPAAPRSCAPRNDAPRYAAAEHHLQHARRDLLVGLRVGMVVVGGEAVGPALEEVERRNDEDVGKRQRRLRDQRVPLEDDRGAEPAGARSPPKGS